MYSNVHCCTLYSSKDMDPPFFIMIFIFSIIAGLQCSVNFLLYSKINQSHVCIHSFSHIILHHAPSQLTRNSFQCYTGFLCLSISKCNYLHLLSPHSQSIPLPSCPLGNHKSDLQVHEFLFCGMVLFVPYIRFQI